MRVGLTGAIGSGKSTVARLLAARGAQVIDADAIARSVLAPGAPAIAEVSAAFPEVVSGGVVDRAGLAAIVFASPAALAKLEAITHPRISEAIMEELEAATAAVVVVDLPLLVEKGWNGMFDRVMVVEAPAQLRLERLLGRGMTEEDIAARQANQASDEQRREIADIVIANDGDEADLAAAVQQAWEGLVTQP